MARSRSREHNDASSGLIILGAAAVGAAAWWAYSKFSRKETSEEVPTNTYETPTGPGAPNTSYKVVEPQEQFEEEEKTSDP